MTLNRALLAGAALAVMAASTDAGAAPAETTPAPAEDTTTPKLYLATATERDPEPGVTAKEVTFVVVASEYKLAWQYARKVTSVGTDHFKKTDVWTDKSCTTRLSMIPGSYTVHAVKSLQDRSKKAGVITADTLIAAFEAKGIKITPAMQESINGLRGNAAEPVVEQTAAAG